MPDLHPLGGWSEDGVRDLKSWGAQTHPTRGNRESTGASRQRGHRRLRLNADHAEIAIGIEIRQVTRNAQSTLAIGSSSLPGPIITEFNRNMNRM